MGDKTQYPRGVPPWNDLQQSHRGLKLVKPEKPSHSGGQTKNTFNNKHVWTIGFSKTQPSWLIKVLEYLNSLRLSFHYFSAQILSVYL